MVKCPCFQSCQCTDADYADKERHNPAQRSCTDVYCLIIFIAFIVGMCLVAAVAGGIGDPKRLIYGVDSWGNACNQANNKKIENVPFSGRNTEGLEKVFYFSFLDAARDTPKKPIICVSSCPNVTIGNTTDLLAYGSLLEDDNINLCRYDIGEDNFFGNVSFKEELCPKDVTPHVSILNRCVPKIALKIGKSIQSGVVNVLDATFEVAEYSRCDAKSSWIRKLANDLLSSWRELLILAFVSLIIVIIVSVLICFFAKIMIWCMYVGAAASALAATEYCWHRWYKLRGLLNDFLPEEQLDTDKALVQSWLTYAIVATILTIIWLIILLYMTRRFELVVEFMQESGYAFRDMPGLLVQPLWTLLVFVTALVAIGAVQMAIGSAGYPQVDKERGFATYVISSSAQNFMQYYCLLGALWVLQFLVACQQYVVAGSVSRWYFTKDKIEVRSYRCEYPLRAHKDLIRFHLGTVMLGSFIITLLQVPRVIMTFVVKWLKSKPDNEPCPERVSKCCCGGLWCFEKFLKFVNRNAYVICSIYGHNFWNAGGKVWTMLFDNIIRMAQVNFVGTFTLFLGQMTIAAIVVIVGMELVQPNYALCYWYAPMLMNAAISLVITYVFLNTFGMSIDSLFLCFNEDVEQNDGTEDNPYFMNSRLAKNIDHKQDFELEMRRKRAAYGKPRQSYKPGRYSRVSTGDITMVAAAKPKRTRRVSQAPEDMW